MENFIFNLKPDIKFQKRKFRSSFYLLFVIITFLYFLGFLNFEFLFNSYEYSFFYVLMIVSSYTFSYFYSKNLYYNVKYKISDSRLVIKSGWFTIKSDSIDLDKIVDMNTVQSLYERNNHLGSIEFLAKDQNRKGKLAVYKINFISNFKEVESVTRELIQKAKGNSNEI